MSVVMVYMGSEQVVRTGSAMALPTFPTVLLSSWHLVTSSDCLHVDAL